MLLRAPDGATAVVLVVNGIGHGESFAAELNRAGFATLLFDLVPDGFCGERMRDVIEWMRRGAGRELPIVVAANGPAATGLARLAADHGDLVQAVILGSDHSVTRHVMGQILVPVLIVDGDLFSVVAGRQAAQWLDRALVPYLVSELV